MFPMQGRVVVAGRQEWIFDPISTSMTGFVSNAVAWLAKGKATPRIACRDSYMPVGFPTASTNVPVSELSKGQVDIYCMAARNSVTDAEAQEIVKFVNGGGSLLVGGQAWSWGSSNYAAGFAGNKWLLQLAVYATSRVIFSCLNAIKVPASIWPLHRLL